MKVRHVLMYAMAAAVFAAAIFFSRDCLADDTGNLRFMKEYAE